MVYISYFHKNEYKNGKLKNVATVAYTFDYQTGALRYGATIFTVDSSVQQWNRRKHMTQAYLRYNAVPVIITLDKLVGHKLNFKQRRQLECYIRNFLLHVIGCHGPNFLTQYPIKYYADQIGCFVSGIPNTPKANQKSIDDIVYDIVMYTLFSMIILFCAGIFLVGGAAIVNDWLLYFNLANSHLLNSHLLNSNRNVYKIR